jgi:hypothetical protein
VGVDSTLERLGKVRVGFLVEQWNIGGRAAEEDTAPLNLIGKARRRSNIFFLGHVSGG